MITAKEALEATKQVHLDRIETIIRTAIDRGETRCTVLPAEIYISNENKEILKSNGFKVVEKETMAGNEIVINWE